MKKALGVLLTFMLVLCLCSPVYADQVDRSGLFANVQEDGSCQVSVTVTLTMEQLQATRFPIPASAYDVQLNGAGIGTYQSGKVQYVDFSSILAPEQTTFSFSLNYTLPSVVDDNGKLLLPLLSGFELPVSGFDFTVTFPSTVTNKPSFTSTYHQSNIENSLYWVVSGSSVSGRTTGPLNDFETLDMTLQLDGSMFSRHKDVVFDTEVDDIAIKVCILLALAYWLLFMRTGIPKVRRCAQPPQGYTAGHFSSILTLQGADLSCMVLSWAQMGYVALERTAKGAIWIHRRMEMGNERSPYERQLFEKLFSKRPTVDTGSVFYAMLCSKVSRQLGPAKAIAHRKNGNRLVFQALALLVNLFAGMSAGLALGPTSGWQIVLVIVFCAAGLACGNAIQSGAKGILLWRPGSLFRAFLASALWIAVHLFSGSLSLGIGTVLFQFLAGLLAAYGGRRTQEGMRSLEQVLGLGLHFIAPEKAQFGAARRADPEYFHALAPYALALGADRIFAYRFGRERIPECPYLLGIPPAERTAAQYSRILRNTVSRMNQRYAGLQKERFINSIYNLRK